MQVELIIRADSMAEIAHLFVAPSGSRPELPAFEQRLPDKVVATQMDAQAGTAKEVEPEAEAPKRTRGKKAEPAAPATEKESPEVKTDASSDTKTASPSSVSLDDIRAAASKVMDSGKASGADIQKLLVEKFDGARAFGVLKPEQYADVLGELENL